MTAGFFEGGSWVLGVLGPAKVLSKRVRSDALSIKHILYSVWHKGPEQAGYVIQLTKPNSHIKNGVKTAPSETKNPKTSQKHPKTIKPQTNTKALPKHLESNESFSSSFARWRRLCSSLESTSRQVLLKLLFGKRCFFNSLGFQLFCFIHTHYMFIFKGLSRMFGFSRYCVCESRNSGT